MSAHEEGCEMAHLCPRSEDEWFHMNEMHRYIYDVQRPRTGAINDVGNVMLLRSDLHTAFDQMKFVFVPKLSSTNAQSIVTHLLAPSVELRRLYHNTELHRIGGIPREFLFARFAWSIFPFLEGFLHDGVPRELHLIPLVVDNGSQSTSAEVCKSFSKQSGNKSRNSSPKKRQRSSAASDIEAAGVMTPKQSQKRMQLGMDPTHITCPELSFTRSSFQSPHALSEQSVIIPGCATQRCDMSDGKSHIAVELAEDRRMFVEDNSILRLKEEYLQNERTRSDPMGIWLKE
jgi:hypothetical protein